jgi:NAD(P)-dependent dehydrogenase (short-subunit alcohol dehydrogenase family)
VSTSEVAGRRVAIVTGAGARQCIGFAAYRRLAQDRCRVAVTDVHVQAATSDAELVAEGFDAAGRQSRDSKRAAVPPIIQSSSSSDAVGR